VRKCVRSPPLDEKKLYRNLAPRAPYQKMPPKKRKAETTELAEMDRELFTKFRAAASCVSGLYTSSLNLQKRAFNGGARHTTGKLLQWAENKLASGEPNISARDLINALQAELVVLQGEDSALSSAAAAVGDASNAGGGAAHWSGNTNDRAAGAGGGGRAAGRSHVSAVDSVRAWPLVSNDGEHFRCDPRVVRPTKTHHKIACLVRLAQCEDQRSHPT
jgi:hypothetical protein